MKGGFYDRFNFTEPYQASPSFTLLPKLQNNPQFFVIPNISSEWGGGPKPNKTYWFQVEDMELEIFRKHEEGAYSKDLELVMLPSTPRYFLGPYFKNPFAQDFVKSHGLGKAGARLFFIFYRLFMARPSRHLQQAMAPTIQRLANRFVIGIQIRLGGNTDNKWMDPEINSADCTKCFIARPGPSARQWEPGEIALFLSRAILMPPLLKWKLPLQLITIFQL